MTELLTRYNKFCIFICTVLAITVSGYAQNGNNDTSQGLPVYDLNINQISSIVSSTEFGGSNSPTPGKYAIEIIAAGTDQGNYLVSAELVSGQWERKMNGTVIERYDLKSHLNDSQSVLTTLGSPTPIAVGYIYDQTNENTSSGNNTENQNTTSGNTSNTQSSIVSSNGLPVYNLTTEQISSIVASYDLGGDNPPTQGKYAIEIIAAGTDQGNYLVRAELEGSIWKRKMTGTDIVRYDLKPWLDTQNDVTNELAVANIPLPSSPVGYISDQTNESTSSGNNTENQDTTSGNTSNTESSLVSSNGLPVYNLTTEQISSIVSSIEFGGNNPPTAGNYAIEIWTDNSGTHNKKLVRAEKVSGQWERKMNGNVIEYYDLKSHLNDSQSALTELGSPTPNPVGYIVDQNNENTSSGNNTENQDTTSGNTSNTESSLVSSNGLPVYNLTTEQISSIVSSIEFGGNNPPTAGNYAIEIWTDNSGTHNKKLVRAELVSGQWERKMNGNVIEYYDLKSHLNDSQSALTELGSPTPIAVGYIVDEEEEEEHITPFDFTIINEIDLANTQELMSLSSDHNEIWFQRVNLADKGYVWALSVESDHEDEEKEQPEDLVIDIDGSVYEGNFYNYWRDGFDIIIDDNSTNWREDRFDANISGIKRLYDRFSEIRGADAPVSPIVRTKKVKAVKGTNGTFSGKLVSDGNNQDLTLGFQFSEDLRFEETREISIKGSTFETSYDFSKFKSEYLYYRAFARNDEFESFGARKRMKIEFPPEVIVTGAKITEGGWESSNWFGYYLPQVNGWIFHEDLGWCFLVIKKNNHWLWMEEFGWVWTTPKVWPHLYRNETASWFYLLKRESEPALIFDRMNGQFLPLQK